MNHFFTVLFFLLLISVSCKKKKAREKYKSYVGEYSCFYDSYNSDDWPADTSYWLSEPVSLTEIDKWSVSFQDFVVRYDSLSEDGSYTLLEGGSGIGWTNQKLILRGDSLYYSWGRTYPDWSYGKRYDCQKM